MPHRVQLKALNLALASALALGVAGFAGAQQNQNNGGPVLPGPSLDDAPPPAPSLEPPVTTAPVPSTPAAAPAPSSAAPAPTSSAAPAPAPSQPAAQASAPAPRAAPVMEQPAVADDAPWYEKAWGSVTGWFSGIGSKLSSPSEPKPAPAAPAAAKPAAAADAARGREGFAADSPERTIRTGMGKCLKTGTWTPGQGDAECPNGASGAGDGANTVAAAPAPAPTPKAEPVEVKPLDQAPDKVAKPLEPEAPKAPEPAPAPAPAPAKPEVMTLSADALFAIGKADLKPDARLGLDELADRLGQLDFESIKIVGHTDPTGATAANDRLSVRRAEAVKRYLVAKGVPANKIKTEGQGSRKPVVAQKECAKLTKAKKAACYQPDRRVEIEVNGAVQRAAAK